MRDWILGRDCHDLDLLCEEDPRPVAESCARLLGTRAESFGQFGTWRVVASSAPRQALAWRVDFARARREEYPEPAALPRVFPAGLREDLFRRDFTVNAMAARLFPKGAGEILDPYGGLEDLRAGWLKPLHAWSFRDDPTRVFRAARYLCRFGLKPAPGLLAQARAALENGHAGLLSRHRLSQELLRVLSEPDPACALSRLKAWGYLGLLGPGGLAWPAEGFKDFKGVEQRLCAMALAMGPAQGRAWISSLPIERGLSARVLEALSLVQERRSPRAAPSPAAAAALGRLLPGLPKAALRPLMLDGRDLKELGLAPGRPFREILEQAARAQWEGRIRSRREALAWLRRRLRFLIRNSELPSARSPARELGRRSGATRRRARHSLARCWAGAARRPCPRKRRP